LESHLKNKQITSKNQPMIGLVEDSGAETGKATLAQITYDRLKEDIFEFRLPPGQRYSEYELARQFNVSRTPLRLALYMLAHEGYLNRMPGHVAWQVKPFDLEYFEDLYEFRIELESVAMRRICNLPSEPDLRELEDFWCVSAKRRVFDDRIVSQEDEKLHRRLVELAGNQEMIRIHADLTERIRIIRRLDFITPKRIEAAYDEHARILGALKARSLSSAEPLIKAHISASHAEIKNITLSRLNLVAQRLNDHRMLANSRARGKR
jgi:DNA-binding GntR family transcriptional regulator